MDRGAQVVILGGGFGGLEAARALQRAPVSVTLVDRRNYHLFQPLLYQVATAYLGAPEITSPLRRVLARQRNARVLLAEVQGLDPARREVLLDGGDRLAYDLCIISLGSVNSYFGHDAWSAHAPALKSIEEALDIRRRVLMAFEAADREPNPVKRCARLTFVVIGAGPTGVELAGALIELAHDTLSRERWSFDPSEARIILLEAKDRVLPLLHPEISEKAHRQLAAKGVELELGAMVSAVDGAGVEWDEGRRRVEARTVLWSAGVVGPAVVHELGLPVESKGKIAVRSDLSVPGHPELFVIGDLAALEQDGQPIPDVAQKAIQMGRQAAQNVVRRLEGGPTEPFHYRDKGYMVVIGRNAAVADLRGRLRIGGFGAWVLWLVTHLLFLIGFRNRLFVLLDWGWAYLTNRRHARLIVPSAKPETRALGREEQVESGAAGDGRHGSRLPPPLH